MKAPTTYIDNPNCINIKPSRTKLLFRAWLDHGPGSSELIEVRWGPTKCGVYDALWMQSDWIEGKEAVAWLPRRSLKSTELWTTLLTAYWQREKAVNNWEGPVYELIPDKQATASSKQLSDLIAIIWPKG
jgi:hypothetical protein